MFLLPDRLAPHPHSFPHFLTRASLLASLAVVLVACGSTPVAPREELPVATRAAPDVVATPHLPPAAQTKLSKPQIAHLACEPPASDTVTAILDYADRVQVMSPAELGQEITRLGDSAVPNDQVQLSLALSQLHLLPELVRAQELLGRVLANADEQAQPLHALSRLLSSRYGEQRRLNDLLDKQSQQTREVQRRLDQTNERLEALKAIERSLTSRSPTANTAPQLGQGQRPSAP
jgi:hypothetical protein